MLTLDLLLGRDYLPFELPPGFVSTSFGQQAQALKLAWNKSAGDCRSSKPVRFNLARHGSLRRQLSIPNPVNQLYLADIICNNWAEIDARIGRESLLSLSRPVLSDKGTPRLQKKFEQKVQPENRARARAGMRYILRTDIARFYPSIYTHSIEWAAIGKSTAKEAFRRGDKRSGGWGKQLDHAVRKAQDNESTGIPIGPMTSVIIAELVLSEVDQGLASMVPRHRGFRYIDDYEIAFADLRAAEAALHALQGELAEFHLQLNPLKTRIVSLPTNLDSPWTAHLKGMFFRPRVKDQRRDLLRLFDIAFELSAKHPDETVQKYALGILRNGVTADADNWRLVENWLMQCIVAEPGTARNVLSELKRYDKLVEPACRVDRDLLGETLKALIRDHIGPGHSSEVAWGLWGMVEFKLPIDEATAKRVVAMDDPIVALLALFCHHIAGIWPKTVGFESYEPYMTHADLRGERWILAYEAMRRGWLQPATPGDALDQDPFFAEMERLGVSFIDEKGELQPGSAPPLPFWTGSGAQ